MLAHYYLLLLFSFSHRPPYNCKKVNQEKVARHLYAKRAYKRAFLVLSYNIFCKSFLQLLFLIYGGNNYGSYYKNNYCTQDEYSRC